MSLSYAKKAAVSAVFLGGAIAAVVIADYDPNFTQAVVALVGALFAVIGVYASKNHTEDDLSKAVAQLQGAAVFVVGYFVTVPASTVEKVTVLSGAVLSAIAVFQVRNEGSP